MKNKAKILNCHSSEVGRLVYDKSNSRSRAEFVNLMNKKENPNEDEFMSKIDTVKKGKMKEVAEADAQARVQSAKDYLDSLKTKRSDSLTCGPRVRVNQVDKLILQQMIFKDLFNSIKQNFPQGIVQ